MYVCMQIKIHTYMDESRQVGILVRVVNGRRRRPAKRQTSESN